MPKKSKKSSDALVANRKKRIEKMVKLLEMSGQGLMKSQVEMKHTPWYITWERQDMIIERQERIIELLEDMLVELKKKKK